MNDSPLLLVRGLTKRFSGVSALQDVSLDVAPGEVLALVGENGAGKSTFLKILSGAQRRDAGEIFLAGVPFDPRTPRQATEAGVSLIYQELALVPQLDAVSNMFLGRQLYVGRTPKLDRAEMHRQAEQVTTRLGLDVDLDKPVGLFSIAQRQGIEIAKALLHQARLLALDEPTSSLTQREQERLFAVINQLREEGVGIIYVSHRLEELFKLADRATVLRDGKLVGTIPISEASHDLLVQMMVGRDLSGYPAPSYRSPEREVLRVDNLRSGTILRAVSLKAHQGQVLGIAGLVGAGRTELLRAIFGADPVDGGDVFIDGKRAEHRTYCLGPGSHSWKSLFISMQFMIAHSS